MHSESPRKHGNAIGIVSRAGDLGDTGARLENPHCFNGADHALDALNCTVASTASIQNSKANRIETSERPGGIELVSEI